MLADDVCNILCMAGKHGIHIPGSDKDYLGGVCLMITVDVQHISVRTFSFYANNGKQHTVNK